MTGGDGPAGSDGPAGTDYDGRVFRSTAAETSLGADTPVGYYHQRADLVWAEFAGGKVRAGRLTGTCDPDGTIRFVYGQVLTDGRMVAGECVSTPEILADGRIRLREQWRRFDAHESRGVSFIEEIPHPYGRGEPPA